MLLANEEGLLKSVANSDELKWCVSHFLNLAKVRTKTLDSMDVGRISEELNKLRRDQVPETCAERVVALEYLLVKYFLEQAATIDQTVIRSMDSIIADFLQIRNQYRYLHMFISSDSKDGEAYDDLLFMKARLYLKYAQRRDIVDPERKRVIDRGLGVMAVLKKVYPMGNLQGQYQGVVNDLNAARN